MPSSTCFLLIAFLFVVFLFLFFVVDVVCLMPLAVRTIISNDHLCRRDVAKDTQDENERITDITLKFVNNQKEPFLSFGQTIFLSYQVIRTAVALLLLFSRIRANVNDRSDLIFSFFFTEKNQHDDNEQRSFTLLGLFPSCSPCRLASDLFILTVRTKIRRAENQ